MYVANLPTLGVNIVIRVGGSTCRHRFRYREHQLWGILCCAFELYSLLAVPNEIVAGKSINQLYFTFQEQ